MTYKSYRLVDGKPRWVIVDENGNIINKYPNKEELKNFKIEIGMNRKTEPFWNKVDVKEVDECWNWKAATTQSGHGMTKLNNEVISSHRAVWKLTYGNIPKGMYVLHKCDNPRCVNPNHLFLGSHSDNLKDCVKKGLWNHRKPIIEDDDILNFD